MTILVGCSGWSYDDWAGRFYPHSLAKTKGRWLAYYARFFPTVEINSSFYQTPGERQVQSWISKGQAVASGFEFSLKMPGAVTHQHLVQKEPAKAAASARAFQEACAAPLHRAGLLGSVLIQLSPHIRASEESLAALETLFEALNTEEHSYALEFRHTSWQEGERGLLLSQARRLLVKRSVAEVLTDGPAGPVDCADAGPSPPGGRAGHAYIRFHGRNSDLWFGREKGEGDFRINRYDYLYSKEEIQEWVPRIKAEEIHSGRVRIYFNNHARAKAVKNAFQLMDLLALPHEAKEVNLQDQYRLGSFGGSEPCG